MTNDTSTSHEAIIALVDAALKLYPLLDTHNQIIVYAVFYMVLSKIFGFSPTEIKKFLQSFKDNSDN